MVQHQIISAKEMEALGIMKRRTALRMAQLGLIPHLRFGEKMRAVGFIPDEVIEALKKLTRARDLDESCASVVRVTAGRRRSRALSASGAEPAA